MLRLLGTPGRKEGREGGREDTVKMDSIVSDVDSCILGRNCDW